MLMNYVKTLSLTHLLIFQKVISRLKQRNPLDVDILRIKGLKKETLKTFGSYNSKCL